MLRLIDNKPFLFFLLILNSCSVIWGLMHDVSGLAKDLTTICVVIAGACLCRLAYMYGEEIAVCMDLALLEEPNPQAQEKDIADENSSEDSHLT